jgi:hypothetical protein
LSTPVFENSSSRRVCHFTINPLPLSHDGCAAVLAWKIAIVLRLPQKFFPRTTQGSLKSDEGRKQDVHLSGFNFLKCSGVQSCHFGESFLGDFLLHSLTANIIAERFELRCLGAFQWHAIFRRLFAILNTPQHGANLISV